MTDAFKIGDIVEWRDQSSYTTKFEIYGLDIESSVAWLRELAPLGNWHTFALDSLQLVPLPAGFVDSNCPGSAGFVRFEFGTNGPFVSCAVCSEPVGCDPQGRAEKHVPEHVSISQNSKVYNAEAADRGITYMADRAVIEGIVTGDVFTATLRMARFNEESE